VKILMVTPHLPPYQAANALLPHQLGQGLVERGHAVRYLTFGDGPDREDVRFVRRGSKRLRSTRLPQAMEALATWRKGAPLVREADVVHVHSNTWMNQVAAGLAARHRRPYVLTHYGTEIWHHDGKDRAFRRMNARASHVAFYSEALLERARELGVPLPAASVVYPPVAEAFRPRSMAEREIVRRRYLNEGRGALLLNVKRLHPLADHSTLLEATARLARERADVRLLIAGGGETEAALKRQAAALGLHEIVRFLGQVPNEDLAPLQAAADAFVLSSVLEATPTVALEALASGTPVVSTDNPGGVELGRLFGDDVAVVPKQDPTALCAAMRAAVLAPRRTRESSARLLAARFRLAGVLDAYLDLYQRAAGA
jgi:glycosyltransferase involved in cell wall biosynthesis